MSKNKLKKIEILYLKKKYEQELYKYILFLHWAVVVVCLI